MRETVALMTRRSSQKVLHTFSWLAAAYLGQSLAEFARAAATQLTSSIAGVEVSWRVTAWQIRAFPLRGGAGGFELWTRLQWPLALAADLTVLLGAYLLAQWMAAKKSQTPGVLQLSVLLAGLWTSANRLWQLGRFALVDGDPQLRQWRSTVPEASAGFPVELLALAAAFAFLGFRAAQGLFQRPAEDSKVSFWRLSLASFPTVAAMMMFVTISLATEIPPRLGRESGASWAGAGPVVILLILVSIALWRQRAPLIPAASPRTAWVSIVAALVLAAGLASAEGIRIRQAEASLDAVRSAHYEVLYDARRWNGAQAEAFAAERETRFADFSRRLPRPQGGPRLQIIVYSNVRTMPRAVRSPFSQPFQLEGPTARIADLDGKPSLSAAEDARLYLAGAWGPSKSPVTAAWVARWIVGEWQGHQLVEWAARLKLEGERLSLAALVEGSNSGVRPPSLDEAIGGAWMQQLAERVGPGAVRRLYESAPEKASLSDLAGELSSSAPELEANWADWINHAPPWKEHEGAYRPADGGFFRGMSLKPTELPTALVERELPRLGKLGVNAVAIITHEHYRGGNRIQYHANMASSDERLIRSIRQAHEMGMRVLLKPQVYEGGDGFAGNICVEDAAARAAWMESYRELILHYARMAQDEGVELFSVGNELSCLTKHEADWRKLIGEVRRVYSGSLTYAANWGEEFETLRFWGALDLIGVNNYYPLTESPGQGFAVMLTRAQRVADTIEQVHRRWRKPVVFTEAGFPSVRGGTFRPWAPPSRQQDEPEQADGYEAVFRTSAEKPWLHGIFWWAWYDGDLSPAGKSAEKVLKTWYGRLAEKAPSGPTP